MRYILLAISLWIAHAARGQSALVQTDTVSGWQLVFTRPDVYFSELQFPSKDTGYVVAIDNSIPSFATHAVLFRSIDRGMKWDSVVLLPFTPPMLPTYDFTSALFGYCNSGTSDSSIIWKTIDGGESWLPHPRNANAAGPIAFSTPLNGVTSGTTERAHTTDGGETWSKVFPKVAEQVSSVMFGDPKTGYAFGGLGYIPPHTDNTAYCEKTTDGGASWEYQYTGIPNGVNAGYAVSSSTVIVCGGDLIGRTTDGGMHWQKQPDASQRIGWGLSISFADPSHGLVAGSDGYGHGQVYGTKDTGQTWSQQQLPENTPLLTSVAMLNDSVALVCGGGNIYRTTTGGRPILGVAQHRTDFQVQIFPNPTTNLLSIRYTLPTTESVSIRYFDVQGKTIGSVAARVQEACTHEAVFDASKLASGTYYFRLTTANGVAGGQFEVGK